MSWKTSKRLTLHTLVTLCCFVFTSVQGQNLIPNGSFEEYNSCPNGLGQTLYLNNWFVPINHSGTSDYYNSCANLSCGVPVNWAGYQMPADSNAYIGLIVLSTSFQEYREYIEVQINAPLIKGVKYDISLEASAADKNSPHIIANFGMYFSKQRLDGMLTPYALNVSPQLVWPSYLSDTINWTQLAYQYEADGNEEFLTVGNFFDDASTMAIYNYYNTPGNNAYLLLDDFKMERVCELNLGNDTTICEGDTLPLNATWYGGTVVWQDSTTQSIYKVHQPGTYIANVTSPRCTVSDTINVAVDTMPNVTLELGNDSLLCKGDTVLLDATIPNSTYLWQDSSTNSTLSVADEGQYFVEVKTGWCYSNDTISIEMIDVDLGADKILCEGTNIHLNAPVIDSSTILWNTGDSSNSIIVNQAGLYAVTLTYNGCVDQDSILIGYKPNPVADIGNDTLLCKGDVLTLDATYPGATYSWYNNGSTLPTFNASLTGNYYVTVNLNGCIDKDSILLIFHSVPEVKLANDTTLCIGDTLVLTVENSYDSLFWQNQSTDTVYSIVSEGNYSITVYNKICDASDSISVDYVEIDDIGFSSDTLLCEGDTIVLNAYQEGANYLWQDGSTDAVYKVNGEGQFSVKVTKENCEESDSISVEWVKNNNVLMSDTGICIGDTLYLESTSNISYWKDSLLNQVEIITEEGTYYISVKEGSCLFFDSVYVHGEYCEISLEIPNVFSPNDDMINDFFTPIKSVGITELNTKIYNRWGRLIYETDDLNINWNGSEATDGLYYWEIQFTNINAKSGILKGVLQLVR